MAVSVWKDIKTKDINIITLHYHQHAQSKSLISSSINITLNSFSGDAQLYYKPHFKVRPISVFLSVSLSLDRKGNQCSLCMPCILLILSILYFFYQFWSEQEMAKLWSEDCECTSIWRDFYFLAVSVFILCGIRCFLGCYSTWILFVDWPRHSCKFHILVPSWQVFL